MIKLRTISLLMAATLFLSSAEQDPEYKKLRMTMVRDHVEARGITNPAVLTAMLKVERELFVPAEYSRHAYDDNPLLIGEGQTISQPYIVALMTSLLNPGRDHRVLEIGTGSGYQAAILAEIVDEVFTIEINGPLYRRASALLDSLGYANVKCSHGDGYLGWPEEAPFDAIIVTCAPGQIPAPLVEQLAEGGRMVIPVGKDYVQELLLLRKRRGELRKVSVAPVLFVPMLDSTGRRYD